MEKETKMRQRSEISNDAPGKKHLSQIIALDLLSVFLYQPRIDSCHQSSRYIRQSLITCSEILRKTLLLLHIFLCLKGILSAFKSLN